MNIILHTWHFLAVSVFLFLAGSVHSYVFTDERGYFPIPGFFGCFLAIISAISTLVFFGIFIGKLL